VYDIYMFVPSVISPPVISPPVVPLGVDVPAAVNPLGELGQAATASGINDIVSPASIVNLSSQAQLLSASTATAAAALDSMLASQDNIAQLTAASRALLEQDINAAQHTALTTTEAVQINTALQSALADAALSDAVAASATLAPLTNTPSTDGTAATAARAAQTPAALAVAAELPNVALNVAAPASLAALPTVAAGNAASATPSAIAGAAPLTPVANPVVSAADPAVAAAIAAYHVGDGIFAGHENIVEENPPDTDIDVMPVPAVEATQVDLHDGARDDATHGVAWNWMRVNPVPSRFTRR
jgi:hypothetical protein